MHPKDNLKLKYVWKIDNNYIISAGIRGTPSSARPNSMHTFINQWDLGGTSMSETPRNMNEWKLNQFIKNNLLQKKICKNS